MNISIHELNNIAKDIHTDPRIIVGSMDYMEFKEWIKDEKKYVLENLLNVLVEYEMYEYASIVNKKISDNN